MCRDQSAEIIDVPDRTGAEKQILLSGNTSDPEAYGSDVSVVTEIGIDNLIRRDQFAPALRSSAPNELGVA